MFIDNLYKRYFHERIRNEILAMTNVKDVLYSTIGDIGKEKILADTASNIGSSQKYMDIIMGACIAKLASESYAGNCNNEETIATLSEALLHFMLTVCRLPSQRKVQLKDSVILDVVIPNLRSLKRNPVKSIVVQIIKDMVDLNKVSQFEFLQPYYNNMWLISVTPLLITKYTIYSVFPNNAGSINSYSNIIIDIDKFLKESGDKSFRFIH
jgi:hypothetical protein